MDMLPLELWVAITTKMDRKTASVACCVCKLLHELCWDELIIRIGYTRFTAARIAQDGSVSIILDKPSTLYEVGNGVVFTQPKPKMTPSFTLEDDESLDPEMVYNFLINAIDLSIRSARIKGRHPMRLIVVVPNTFTVFRRTLVLQATQELGHKVLRIVTDSTCAVIGFLLSKPELQKALVCVSVLNETDSRSKTQWEIDEGVVEEKACFDKPPEEYHLVVYSNESKEIDIDGGPYSKVYRFNEKTEEEHTLAGAALYFAILTSLPLFKHAPSFHEEVITLENTKLTISLETAGGVATPMIIKGSMIPTKRSQVFTTYSDNPPAILIQFFEGNRSLTRDNVKIARYEVAGIVPAPRGVPQIQVTMNISENMCFSATACDKTQGMPRVGTHLIQTYPDVQRKSYLHDSCFL